jgi:FdhD protein
VDHPPAIRRIERADGVSDIVVVEEPLAIQLRHGPLQARLRTPFTTTLRTPGDEADLIRGLIVSEKIINEPNDLIELAEIEANHWRVELHPDVAVDPARWERTGWMTSACGLCGRKTLDGLEADWPTLASGPVIAADVIRGLPSAQRSTQKLFAETGALHAASLATITGKIIATREDVGRHNAVDKVLGAIWPDTAPVLVVSGRAGFELLHKAAIAGVPIFVAVGAPTSLAIDLAARAGITLIGFARPERFNLYTHPERVLNWQ